MKNAPVLLLLSALILSCTGCGEHVTQTPTTATESTALPASDPTDVPAGTTPDESTPATDAPAESTAASLLGNGKQKLLSVRLTVSFDNDTVTKDEKFGAALLSMSQEEFEAIGFCLGDSCDLVFLNGYTLTDVPYYNGYYVKNGNPVIVAYPGDPFVRVTLNNLGIWDAAGLSEGDTVTITLNEAGKYRAVQEALGQIYSFDRKDYPNDAAFSNFRAMSGGDLKENFLYRGASPVDNSRGRAACTDALLQKNGIRFVIDLADSEANMQKYLATGDFASDYVKGLYEKGDVALLDMGSAYTSRTYKEKVVKGLRAALNSDGPIYIHCMEGKDRTGFVCMLLEALAGAGYEEMKSDYMITYENYFRVSKAETPEKYDAIVDLYFFPFMEFLHGTSDIVVLQEADYTDDAAAYLKDGGMTEEEIARLTEWITK